jgi:hypothetical protein
MKIARLSGEYHRAHDADDGTDNKAEQKMVTGVELH